MLTERDESGIACIWLSWTRSTQYEKMSHSNKISDRAVVGAPFVYMDTHLSITSRYPRVSCKAIEHHLDMEQENLIA